MNKKIPISDILSKIPNDYKYKVINFSQNASVNFAFSILEVNKKGSFISFIDKTKAKKEKEKFLKDTLADIVIIDFDFLETDKICIVVEDPKLIFSIIVNHFFVKQKESFIHPSSIISETATIGDNCFVGPNVIIGDDSKIGSNCKIFGNVTIYDNVAIGNNVVINSGTVIGADGFGYLRYKDKTINFPHIGGVIIENNVEIGANTCIDKGALGNTVLKENVIIDNLVHIAHNVVIDSGSWVIANSMVAGSVKIGKNSWIAPSSCIRDTISIGENNIIGLGSVLLKNTNDNEVWYGVPAKKK